MSPTVFREKGFRYFFFSREELRMHVHARSAEGEAKFWLEPDIELDRSHGLKESQLNQLEKTVRERKDELIEAWQKHFGS